MLFAGSVTRQASGLCEVELVLDNEDGTFGSGRPEVSVMRRLAREGGSNYLLNRVPVRRLDVQEALADAGLGRELHAVIGQGKVEEILLSRPTDRRGLIEEAAGLGKYKRRRHRALGKMRRVEDALARARDLERELAARLRPLQLQATAAERAALLGEEADRLRLDLLASEVAAARRARQRLTSSLREIAEGAEVLERSIEAAAAERRAADRSSPGSRASASARRRRRTRCAGRRARVANRAASLRERLGVLDEEGGSGSSRAARRLEEQAIALRRPGRRRRRARPRSRPRGWRRSRTPATRPSSRVSTGAATAAQEDGARGRQAARGAGRPGRTCGVRGRRGRPCAQQRGARGERLVGHSRPGSRRRPRPAPSARRACRRPSPRRPSRATPSPPASRRPPWRAPPPRGRASRSAPRRPSAPPPASTPAPPAPVPRWRRARWSAATGWGPRRPSAPPGCGVGRRWISWRRTRSWSSAVAAALQWRARAGRRERRRRGASTCSPTWRLDGAALLVADRPAAAAAPLARSPAGRAGAAPHRRAPARLLDGIHLVDDEADLLRVERGVAVMRDGRGVDADRGVAFRVGDGQAAALAARREARDAATALALAEDALTQVEDARLAAVAVREAAEGVEQTATVAAESARRAAEAAERDLREARRADDAAMLEDEALEARVARGREEVEEAEALAQAAGSEGASLVDERAAATARVAELATAQAGADAARAALAERVAGLRAERATLAERAERARSDRERLAAEAAAAPGGRARRGSARPALSGCRRRCRRPWPRWSAPWRARRPCTSPRQSASATSSGGPASSARPWPAPPRPTRRCSGRRARRPRGGRRWRSSRRTWTSA